MLNKEITLQLLDEDLSGFFELDPVLLMP